MKTKKKSLELPAEGFARIDPVLNAVGVAKTTLYEMIGQGLFPAPIKLTKRTSVWSVREVRAFIEKLETNGVNA